MLTDRRKKVLDEFVRSEIEDFVSLYDNTEKHATRTLMDLMAEGEYADYPAEEIQYMIGNCKDRLGLEHH